MKYIRTKDGNIYQVYDKVFEYKENKRYQLVDSRFEISLNDIVKEANTIQELCDAFVVIDGKQVAELHNFKSAKNTKGELHAVIYITDKDGNEEAKTVAKLDEKGELELL